MNFAENLRLKHITAYKWVKTACVLQISYKMCGIDRNRKSTVSQSREMLNCLDQYYFIFFLSHTITAIFNRRTEFSSGFIQLKFIQYDGQLLTNCFSLNISYDFSILFPHTYMCFKLWTYIHLYLRVLNVPSNLLTRFLYLIIA